MREKLLKIAEKVPTRSSFKFVSPEKVKEKTIKGALKSYAKDCAYEDIIAVMDTTLMHGGKSGFILTEKKLYSDLFVSFLNDKIMYVSLEGLTEAKPDKQSHLLLAYDDGHSQVVYFSTYAPYINELLRAIIRLKNTQGTAADTTEDSSTEEASVDESSVEKISVEEASDERVSVEGVSVETISSETISAGDSSVSSKEHSLEDEWKAYEKEKLAFEKEKEAFEKEKKTFEKGKKTFEKEKKTFEKEKKAFEKEKKAFETAKQNSEKKKPVQEKDEKDAQEAEKELAQEKIQKEKQNKAPECDIAFAAGLQCYQKEDYTNAVRFFERAAEMGNKEAPELLVKFYYNGIGVPADKKKAAFWLGKSAEQGDADKQFGLAAMYLKGEDVEADMEMAEYWMEKAASQGHEQAKEGLKIIRHNKGIDCYNKGISKIKQASINSDMKATVEDLTDALSDLEKAGELGLVNAQSMLASYFLYGNARFVCRLLTGDPCEQERVDPERGMYWLKKAVENEDADSLLLYAKYLLFGQVNCLDETAFDAGPEYYQYKKSANTKEALNYAVKASLLGSQLARFWLNQASENHIPGAKEALKRADGTAWAYQ